MESHAARRQDGLNRRGRIGVHMDETGHHRVGLRRGRGPVFDKEVSRDACS